MQHRPAASDWQPDHPAVHVTRLRGSDGRLHVALVSHPSRPFPGPAGPLTPSDTLEALREVADAYLHAVGPLLGTGLIAQRRLQWLQPTDDGRERRGAHWIERRDAAGTVLDRTLVLTAGPELDDSSGAPGGGIGLAVTLHVAATGGGFRVRITGVIANGIDRLAALPATPVNAARFRSRLFLRELSQSLGVGELQLDGILPQQRADGGIDWLLSGGARRTTRQRSSVVAWSARVQAPAGNGADWRIEPGPVVEQAAAAGIDFTVFGQDGASQSAAPLSQRAPTRSQTVLQALRSAKRRIVPPDLEVATHAVLPAARRDRLPPPPPVEPVPAADPPRVRSRDLAAVQTFHRGAELFERYAGYGLALAQCIRRIVLPLRLRHLPVLPEAPDGDVVNARVVVVDTGPLPALEVQFASACVTHRERITGERGAQSLGLAADPRWAWHEFGHVVIQAATEALEFPFAHSAGDALAAIVAAPASQLGAPQSGLTFPWVTTTRRHDRSAMLGWCWCGHRSRLRLAPDRNPGEPRRHAGYTEEQMLSSSLFRAYLALGGATAGADSEAAAVRQRASDYAVYLILRAIAHLPSWTLVPLRSAEQFVDALAAADVGTGVWLPLPTWHTLPTAQRLGGSAHKVLRWAFEQQGLYATADPHAVREGVGLPPPVDLYLARTTDADGRDGDGGYAPVPLLWSDAALFLASGETLDFEAPDRLSVKVCNRGAQTSAAGTVRVWTAPDAATLVWSAAVTVALGPVGGANGTPGVRVVPVTLPGGGPTAPVWVLAEVSCDGDPAVTDPAAMLPCAVAGVPPADRQALIDLVAGDNNLGLRLVDPS